MWRKIKKMNCSLIDKAATKYRRLRKPSQKAHSREFMDFLRRELKDPALPDPVY